MHTNREREETTSVGAEINSANVSVFYCAVQLFSTSS